MGKCILILGASSEIGLCLIKAIASEYDIIYAHYGRNSAELQKLRTQYGEKIVLIQDDLSSPQAGMTILETIENNGVYPQHIVHIPAPVVENIRFTKSDWKTFEENFKISIRSAVNILPALFKRIIKEHESGRVIFVLSSYTENLPPKFMSPYVTTKYALLGLMRALSAEYADKGIMVNGISPGMMETKFLDKTFDHAVEENAAKSPFGRNLYVDEVIPTMRFLLSDDAKRITGQNIVVSGGM